MNKVCIEALGHRKSGIVFSYCKRAWRLVGVYSMLYLGPWKMYMFLSTR